MLAKPGAVADNVLAEPQPRDRLGEQGLQAHLALDERRSRCVLSVQEQEVERKQDEVAGSALVHCGLQATEGSHPIRPDGAKLPVEIGVLHRQSAERRDRRLIAMAPVEAGAGQQPDVAAFDAGVHAIAVVLDLVKPVRAVRCLVDEPRELRLDPSGRGLERGSLGQFRAPRHSTVLSLRYSSSSGCGGGTAQPSASAGDGDSVWGMAFDALDAMTFVPFYRRRRRGSS